jgi:hypothetical protein
LDRRSTPTTCRDSPANRARNTQLVQPPSLSHRRGAARRLPAIQRDRGAHPASVYELPLFYLVGGVACLFSRYSQRLGDLAANTIVVRDLKTSQPDLNQLLGARNNSMLEHRQLAARLGHRVPAAATIALDALLRRDHFEPRALVERFAELAAYFKSLVEFPPEATEQLNDEQYVRNVAQILFAKRS